MVKQDLSDVHIIYAYFFLVVDPLFCKVEPEVNQNVPSRLSHYDYIICSLLKIE